MENINNGHLMHLNNKCLIIITRKNIILQIIKGHNSGTISQIPQVSPVFYKS